MTYPVYWLITIQFYFIEGNIMERQVKWFGMSSAIVYLSISLSALAESAKQPLELWYSQPATRWTDALPVGNGHMGAMVYFYNAT